MQDMYPCDVYIQYSYRIDVLQVHDFVLHTAVKPPNTGTPQDYFSWSFGWWDGFLSGIANWFANPLNSLFLFIILGIIGFLVLVFFCPTILLKLFGDDGD